MEVLPEAQQTRLVIAVDYGTTHTGIAWATPAGNQAILSDIKIVTDWGTRMANQEKVPSVISFSMKHSEDEQQWGSDLSKDAIAMMHTKLQLDVEDTSTELEQVLESLEGMHNLDFQYIINAEGKPKYTRKGPEEIVSEYLDKVFPYLLKTIANLTAALVNQIQVDIVVTIPAQWGYRAKNSTFRALTKSGFNKTKFPQLKDVFLISEPEAAAIYTARYLKEQLKRDFLQVGECFVLCDAGGGTVDVVSYEVKQLEPNFVIGRIGLPAGRRCGAIFINLAFKKWLRDLIGIENYQLLDQGHLSNKISSHDAEGEQMRDLMKRFDIQKKRFFPDSRDVHLDLPAPHQNLNLDGKVHQGQITISNQEMRSFFEPCAARIVNLINDQREMIEEEGTRLKNVFLVGGFAESPYLQASIKESLSLLPVSVELRRPDTSLTAVVRGAALFGIEKSPNKAVSTMSACPRSYGIAINEPFSDVAHHPKDRDVDPFTKLVVAKGQLKWLIRKGDLVLSDQIKEASCPIERTFLESGEKKGTIPIYSYDRDDLPERFENSRREITQVYLLGYDLTTIPLGEFQRHQSVGSISRAYTAYFTLKMRVGPEGLRVQLCLQEREVSVTIIPDPLLRGLATLSLSKYLKLLQFRGVESPWLKIRNPNCEVIPVYGAADSAGVAKWPVPVPLLLLRIHATTKTMATIKTTPPTADPAIAAVRVLPVRPLLDGGAVGCATVEEDVTDIVGIVDKGLVDVIERFVEEVIEALALVEIVKMLVTIVVEGK